MSEQQKSFAERFASKKNAAPQRSANQIQQKSTAPKEQESGQQTSQQQPIDPQKRMQAEQIYLVKGIDAGRKAWYYVLVDRLKVQLFLKALNDDIIHLENYGKILYSAYGEEPPAEITGKLKSEYGIK